VDVLVTDYSSAIFDFAATRRPMVFFVPDLETYRDEVRGFSIDFEAEVPGPLLRTTGDVVDALRQPDQLAADYRERYEAFVAKYCTLADGQASSRVVDRVFRW
jgi:CDP-glycerol glycerophosphotransferase